MGEEVPEARSPQSASPGLGKDPYHKTVVVHVHDEVLAHHGQTDECDVCPVGEKSHDGGDCWPSGSALSDTNTLHHFILLLF